MPAIAFACLKYDDTQNRANPSSRVSKLLFAGTRNPHARVRRSAFQRAFPDRPRRRFLLVRRPADTFPPHAA